MNKGLLLIVLGIFLTVTGFAQITIPDTDPLPADSIPFSGTFFSALNPTFPPLPANINGYPAWNLGGSVFLLDDLDSFSGRRAMDDAGPPGPPGDVNPDTNTFVPFVAPTNGQLWLQITNLNSGWVYLNLNSCSDAVYEILTKTNLADTNWTVEGEIWPTNTNAMPFTVPQAGRTNLFIWARDWTGVTENGNTTPSWWFYWFYGANAFYNGVLTLSDTNLDSQGNTLLSDYTNGLDPNVISFTLVVTNNYSTTSYVPIQLNVSAGIPDYLAISVDDTNYQADASWTAYSSSNITVDLGLTEGWHTLWIGLRGLPANATTTWQYKRVKLDTTAPSLVITNPTVSTVSVPLLQVSGYCTEALANISYDLTNAAGTWSNLDAGITSQFYSTNTFEFTTNFFEAVDIPLTNGVNSITLHATDLAGNATTSNISITLDYSSRTNPPVVSLYWPQNGTLICNSNYTWRGWVDDPTAIVVAQIVDTNGATNIFNGIVERDGNFWVENLPLCGGTNWLTLTVTDSAGNVATTNITVSPSTVALTIDPPASSVLWSKYITVTGTIDNVSDYTVWVNGVKASISNDNTWSAHDVYLPTGGTAVIQASAIPNTDNGGNGTGGSGGGPSDYGSSGNPSSTQANVVDLQTDKPDEIVQTSDYYNFALNQIGTDVTSSNVYSVQWFPDTPYHIYFDEWGNTPDTVETSLSDSYIPASPECYYDGLDCSGTNTKVSTDNGVTTTIVDLGLPRAPASEHSEMINSEYISGDGQITEHFTAQSTFVLHTGGKGVAMRQNLFQISCSALQYTNLFYLITPVPVPPQLIQIMGKVLDVDGNMYIQLADNVTRDVTAFVAGADYYTFTNNEVKYTSSITYNGRDVTDAEFGDYALNQTIVGRIYTLNLSISPKLPTNFNTAYHWTVGGDPLLNWLPTSTNSQKVYVTNLTNSSVAFGWYTPGSKSVSCKVTITGPESYDVTLKTFANVFRPSASLRSVDPRAAVSVDDHEANSLELHFGDATNSVEFGETNNYLGGSYDYLQVDNVSRIYTYINSPHTATRSGPGLDGSFPFAPITASNTVTDVPGDGLTSTMLSATAHDDFTMYLMFIPNPIDSSFYVPLRKLEWKYYGVALPDTNSIYGWSLVPGSSPSNPIGQDEDASDYPVWTNNTEIILSNPIYTP